MAWDDISGPPDLFVLRRAGLGVRARIWDFLVFPGFSPTSSNSLDLAARFRLDFLGVSRPKRDFSKGYWRRASGTFFTLLQRPIGRRAIMSEIPRSPRLLKDGMV